MSIPLLKTLIAIAEEGSFAAAAEKVCVTQAAVGQQMRRLEDELGHPIFDRSKKAPQLNQLGWALVPKARDIIHAYDSMLDDLVGDAQFIGELSLGVIPSALRALVPISIKQLVEIYPDLHIRVVPGLSGDLHEQVERGALDAAIVSMPARISENMNWQPFVEEDLVLITAEKIDADDPIELLRTMPYIRHTRRAAVGVLADEWLDRNKISVRVSMEMESLEMVSSMVSHNLGVSIVPNICVPDPVFAKLNKLPLKGTVSPRIVGMYSRLDCSKRLLVERLLEELMKTVAAHKALK